MSHRGPRSGIASADVHPHPQATIDPGFDGDHHCHQWSTPDRLCTAYVLTYVQTQRVCPHSEPLFTHQIAHPQAGPIAIMHGPPTSDTVTAVDPFNSAPYHHVTCPHTTFHILHHSHSHVMDYEPARYGVKLPWPGPPGPPLATHTFTSSTSRLAPHLPHVHSHCCFRIPHLKLGPAYHHLHHFVIATVGCKDHPTE
eukprot:202001-Amphidinium_carterae.2